MRPEAEYQEALSLIESGLNDTEVGRQLGIPRRTVHDWRAGMLANSGGRTNSWSGKRRTTCFRCTGDRLDEAAYAYLLGIYLGDGWIWNGPKGVSLLRVTCDLRYPGIINEIATHVVIVLGRDTVGFANRTGCVDVYAHWKHWQCAFPQHGPGRKHERPIVLEPWQQVIVSTHPKELIRGLIHSDGNRHINKVTRKLKDGPKRYRYPRYMFTNASTDIMGIFTDALDLLGIHWTRTMPRVVAVSRRDDVAFLDTFVGPKF